eukprot:TRINITY_DN7129_c0_g4_i2.p2 TRINITY_DN7129_c0_g4~~TRINITY_DN7129_c0_g4_i2.p2  ORF type:complete len:342 (-),score=82.04 TRINITY_DN7129_c0_g4_i2:125-1150(-)
MSKVSKNRILGASFNQDKDCFACGTESGIAVYQSVPYKEVMRHNFDRGIAQVFMLYRSNVLALVGGGENPKYPPKKVMLWDDKQKQCVGELSFKFPVNGVRLHRELIIVALDFHVHVYRLSDLEMLDAIETCRNAQGICEVSSKGSVVVCPDAKEGAVRAVNYENSRSAQYPLLESPISAVSVTQDGKVAAVSSEDGKTIIVFDTSNGWVLHELYRGASKVEISCLAFDSTGDWLLCSSDKETVHVFSVQTNAEDEEGKEPVKNSRQSLKLKKGFSSNFGAEKSLAQFRTPHRKAVVAFGEPGKYQVIIVTYEGKYYRIGFDPKAGGECRKLEEKSLFADK